MRDIGRIERSLFMLGWYSDPELRRRTGLGLNKGEARNTLARANRPLIARQPRYFEFRHLTSAQTHRTLRAVAMSTWHEAIAAT